MALYTFVMDYRGGTYLSQVEASKKEAAMRLWLEQLEVGFHKDFTEEVKAKLLLENFEDEKPVRIEDLINTWFFGQKFKKWALVHFTKTCK